MNPIENNSNNVNALIQHYRDISKYPPILTIYDNVMYNPLDINNKPSIKLFKKNTSPIKSIKNYQMIPHIIQDDTVREIKYPNDPMLITPKTMLYIQDNESNLYNDIDLIDNLNYNEIDTTYNKLNPTSDNDINNSSQINNLQLNKDYFILLNIETNMEENLFRDDVIPCLYRGTHTFPNKLTEKQKCKMQRLISKINNYCPLFDPYTDNLYLIQQKELYGFVFLKSYRFPTARFIKESTEKYKEYKIKLALFSSKDHETNKYIILSDTIKRYKLMLKFLTHFDIGVLLKTYIISLYNTDELGKNITICMRPSFSPRITNSTPYFSTDEIINMSLNNGYIDLSTTISQEVIRDLCKLLKENDINCENILKHNNYIIKQNKVSLIQYYSIQGFILLNKYLREYEFNNDYLNGIVREIVDTIHNAPKLDKDYILYRFIVTDDFIKYLQVGDLFKNVGFMSTTRNPFYKQNNMVFGWYLMKIKVPSRSSLLCIETISKFPTEEEIILPPDTVLKLISKNKSNIYYHTDKKIQNSIKTVYEFEVVETPLYVLPDKKQLPRIMLNNAEVPAEYTVNDYMSTIDFLTLDHTPLKNIRTIIEKTSYFINHYTNSLNQFNVISDNKLITITIESYNSLVAYKRFYYIQSDNGVMFYSIYKNLMLFNIELSNDMLYINYNSKYISNEYYNIISDDNFLKLIASIAYYFNIPKIRLYCDYLNCDYLCNTDIDDTLNIKYLHVGGSICKDIYEYIKDKKIRFKTIPQSIIKPEFNYYNLDLLKDIHIDGDFFPREKYILRQIFKKLYKIKDKEKKKRNARDFYLWLVTNNCYYITDLIEILSKRIELPYNLFKQDYYTFYPFSYLYNNNFINIMPNIRQNTNTFKQDIFNKKQDYRITYSNIIDDDNDEILTTNSAFNMINKLYDQ